MLFKLLNLNEFTKPLIWFILTTMYNVTSNIIRYHEYLLIQIRIFRYYLRSCERFKESRGAGSASSVGWSGTIQHYDCELRWKSWGNRLYGSQLWGFGCAGETGTFGDVREIWRWRHILQGSLHLRSRLINTNVILGTLTFTLIICILYKSAYIM